MSYDPYDGEYDEYENDDYEESSHISGYGDALSYEVYEEIFGDEENFTDPEDYDDARARWDAYCMRTVGHYVDPDDI